jgi:hypothetical protein
MLFTTQLLVRMPGPGMNIKKIVGEKNEMEKYGMKKEEQLWRTTHFCQ